MTDDDRSGSSNADAMPLPPFFARQAGDNGPRPVGGGPAAPFFPASGGSAPERPASPAPAASPVSRSMAEEPAERSPGDEEDLPDDIFFVPEGAARPVAARAGEGEGMHAVTAKRAADEAAIRMAARLERLATKLRLEGSQALHEQMSAPDRLDALLAAMLAGYVAGDA